MHIEYAAEAVRRMTQPKHSAPLAARDVVAAHAAEPELLALADALGDAKSSSIVGTIRKNAGSRYARVTPAQKGALAGALLGRYGSPQSVYAAAFGVTESDFAALVAAVD